MAKDKRKDMWIITINEEGVHNPLHVFKTDAKHYLCDQIAHVSQGNVVIADLEEVQQVPKDEVTLLDIDIQALPNLASIERRWYAATVESSSALADALSKTLPKEETLREKIRQEHKRRLCEQQSTLISQAAAVLRGKERSKE